MEPLTPVGRKKPESSADAAGVVAAAATKTRRAKAAKTAKAPGAARKAPAKPAARSRKKAPESDPFADDDGSLTVKSRAGIKGNITMVIVESPTKAKTLRKILPKDYNILASVGHVIDLPASKLGVDVDNGFKPQYITIRGKEKILKELKEAAGKARHVLLATDPDREGEAISWHLARALHLDAKDNVRVLIPEFTKSVVEKAINNPIPLDLQKVDSQQARRVLDRIVGYKISPLLWRKVQSGLSAGRVQSVALKLVVDREREVKAFNAEEYWTLTLDLHASSDADRAFQAELRKVDGKNETIRTQADMERIVAEIQSMPLSILKIATIKKQQRPAAPFITSTIQQAASQIFNFTPRKTMMIAQQLYEGVELEKGKMLGLITYMRTDSVRVSPEAQTISREFLTKTLGAEYLPATPPVYKTAKGRVQDAHEAIRPTDPSLDPTHTKEYLTSDQYKLYALVWARFLASQMVPAEFAQKTVDVTAVPQGTADPTTAAHSYTFRAVGREKLFDGYLRIYAAQKVLSKKVKESFLPTLTQGEALTKVAEKAEQSFTQPPPHFTEAGLVKTLEENGIGRPSTYATIISTLVERNYVERVERNLLPTELGNTVVELLESNFQHIMNVTFTAGLEDELDSIESGQHNWQDVLGRFYDDFKVALSEAEKKMRDLKKEVEQTDQVCELCAKPMVIRRGRFGKFMACSGFPGCRNTKELPREGQPAEAGQELDETCEKCGSKMQMRKGRFGAFKACSKYPECKTTKPVLAKLGIKCPQEGCNGDVVQRFTKRKRIFYGCGEYPKCNFTSWVRLAPGQCPTCKGYLLEKRAKNVLQAIMCAKKDCGWSREPEATETTESDAAA